MLIRASETFLAQKGQASYYKAFVTLHKMKLAPLLSLLEAKKWEEVEAMLSQQRTQVFSSFLHYDAKYSSQKKVPLCQILKLIAIESHFQVLVCFLPK